MNTIRQNPFVWSLLMVWLGLMLLSFGGCEEPPPPPPPQQKVEKTEPPPATEEETTVPEEGEEDLQELEEEEEDAGFSYEAGDRREPFRTLITEELPDIEDILVTPTPGGIVEGPLQKFDVKELVLRGIVLGSLGDYAKILAPDGKSYTINIGTRIGKLGGEVISITDNSVIVKETRNYESGKIEEAEIPLYLNPLEEEE